MLSGGELAALVIVDAVAGWCRAWWATSESVAADSFSRGLLDYPHYTRPAEFRGLDGARRAAVGAPCGASTRGAGAKRCAARCAQRPDLLAGATLDDDERRVIRELSEEGADHERD